MVWGSLARMLQHLLQPPEEAFCLEALLNVQVLDIKSQRLQLHDSIWR